MRCSFPKLFLTQLKRAAHVLPAAVPAALFLCLAIGIFAFGVLKTNSESEEKSMLRVAYVGELSDYMGFNVDSVINVVSEQFGVTLEGLTEEEAKREMLLGHLTTYIVFPKGFVESVDSGDNNLRITYVTAEGEKGIAGTLLSESLDSVSKLMTTSQGTFYSAYDFLKDAGRRDLYYDAGAALEEAMVRAISGVINATEVQTVGVSNGIGFTGYYFCSVILIFISLSGIGAVAFFTNRSNEFQRSMRRSGQNEIKQIVQEFVSFLLIQIIGNLIIYFALYIVVSKDILYVPELGRHPIKALNSFGIKMVPVVLALYALQFLIYELMESTISAVLAQFITAIALGYISGFYYPMDFMPEQLTNATRILPTGLALRQATGALAGNGTKEYALGLLVYTIVFLGLAAVIRHKRLTLDR